MKRFKLQTGHIVKVDDCDAYIMRSKVWVGQTPPSGNVIVHCHDAAMKGRVLLSHYVTSAPDGAYVMHKNGDDLDFTRDNLEVVSRSEFYKRVTAAKKLTALVMHA